MPTGELRVHRQGGRMVIDQADGEVRISEALLREIRAGAAVAGVVLDGDLLRIDGVNRTVVYRLLGPSFAGSRLAWREDLR